MIGLDSLGRGRMSLCGDTDGPVPCCIHARSCINNNNTINTNPRQTIETVVGEELAEWSVHEKVHVSYAELHDALLRIRRRLEGPRGITTGELPLLRFVVGAFVCAFVLGVACECARVCMYFGGWGLVLPSLL